MSFKWVSRVHDLQILQYIQKNLRESKFHEYFDEILTDFTQNRSWQPSKWSRLVIFSSTLQKLVDFTEWKCSIDVIWQNECAYRWKVLFSLRYGYLVLMYTYVCESLPAKWFKTMQTWLSSSIGKSLIFKFWAWF